MKLRHAIAAGSLLLGWGQTALGQGPACPPCIDRPTPPPCCADGQCYANPLYGYYPTRWRLWPVEPPSPTAVRQFNPEKLQGQVPAFVTPPAEEEDRKAPPPTTPPDETSTPSRTPSAGGPNATSPAGEGTLTPPGGSAIPPTTPLRPPGDGGEPTGPRRTLPPYTPQSPSGRPANGPGPMGDADPPPALPFGPMPIRAAQPARALQNSAAAPAAQPPQTVAPRATSVNSNGDDPPPALPQALATLKN